MICLLIPFLGKHQPLKRQKVYQTNANAHRTICDSRLHEFQFTRGSLLQGTVPARREMIERPVTFAEPRRVIDRFADVELRDANGIAQPVAAREQASQGRRHRAARPVRAR